MLPFHSPVSRKAHLYGETLPDHHLNCPWIILHHSTLLSLNQNFSSSYTVVCLPPKEQDHDHKDLLSCCMMSPQLLAQSGLDKWIHLALSPALLTWAAQSRSACLWPLPQLASQFMKRYMGHETVVLDPSWDASASLTSHRALKFSKPPGKARSFFFF